jgi:CheY-like chemotaxis protein
MDIQMPEMDGFQATAEIRSMAPPIACIPIVAMTANALEGDREKCLAAGMDGYLAKPVDRAKIADAIARFCPPSGEPSVLGSPENNGSPRKPGRRVLATVETGAPMIDEDGLADLAEFLGEEEIASLMEEYLVYARDLLPKLDTLCAKRDWATLAFEAHTFKGTSGNMRLVELSMLSLALEMACKERRGRNAPTIIAALKDRFEAIDGHLRQNRRTAGNG